MEVQTAESDAALEQHIEEREQTTPLELFFDLVFVFAFTQVTTFIAADPTWGGMGRGMLVLAAVWWAWAGYTWLTDSIDPEEELIRAAIFLVMAAMFVVALAIPGVFEADALLFGVAYFVVRAMHLAIYALGARRANDADLLSAVRGFAPSATLAPALLIAAAAFDGVPQGAIWVAALSIDFGGAKVMGMEGWRVSPSHFAERHGLIVIIALGESIVAIGASAAGIEVDLGVVLAATLGLVVSGTLWWAYFDVVAIVAQRKLAQATGVARTALARDSYSYIHLAMIAGIILFALGAKKTLLHIDEPLNTVPAFALCGGVALYFLAHIAFRMRNVGSVNKQRVVAIIACLATIPVALNTDAIVSLALITAICVCLIAYEVIRFSDARARVRSAT